MRRLAYGGATLAFMGAAASAADLPVKAPPYTAPPAPLGYDWSGFYVGANAGYGVGRDPAGETKTTMLIGGLPASAITNEQFMLSPAGALGGVQLGYNWQIAPHWVAGLEGDWDASGQRDSVCIAQCTDFGAGTPVGLTVEQKISWLATTRARLGYAQGGWLAYLTGGGAFGHVTDNVTATFTSFGPPTVHTGAASFSRTLGGWGIGAGVAT